MGITCSYEGANSTNGSILDSQIERLSLQLSIVMPLQGCETWLYIFDMTSKRVYFCGRSSWVYFIHSVKHLVTSMLSEMLETVWDVGKDFFYLQKVTNIMLNSKTFFHQNLKTHHHKIIHSTLSPTWLSPTSMSPLSHRIHFQSSNHMIRPSRPL